MSSISRLSNSSPARYSSGLEESQKQQPVQPRTLETPKSNPIQNLFSADGFGQGTGGAQDLAQKLEQLVQTVSKLAELLGGQGAEASQGGGTPGMDSSSPMGVQGGEQVPELGGEDVAQGQTAQPQTSMGNAQTPANGGSDSVGGVSGTQGSSSNPGTTDAKDFLSKGPHAKDKVYPEIAHDSPGLGEKNKALWDAAHKAGASDEEASVMVAQQMQEGGNDPTKSGGAENFGPLNLNRGLLKDFGGVAEGDLQKLNENSGGKYTPEALEANAKASLTAMRTMGTERYLDHVRGGGSGYERPTERLPFAGPKTADDDTRRFGRNIANAANRVLEDFKKDPASLGRDWRQAADIPYV